VNQDSQTDVKSEHVVDPEVWVDDHGDVLYRFALARLRNSATAEDLVQETLLAAFKAKDRFEGRASVRSWLVGILKNKIIDFFRKRSRETSFSDLEFMRGELGDRMKASALMGEHWIAEQGPREWASPEDSLSRAEFWGVLRSCADKLPDKIAGVFLMREVDGVASEEICEVFNISPNNFWVMLHRARLALRQCLELNWFQAQGMTGGGR
jgi:RNA polymerase sigma-70 factor (TIGR02943 family)